MASRELQVAIRAAKEAGRRLMKSYGAAVVMYKTDGSIVTQADIESEEAIRAILKKGFPHHSFLGEETGYDDSCSDHVWIVDPLDGTTNYSISNPFFDVSIALVYKRRPILGVVYYPPTNELFYAEKGSGAYLNDKRISVSNRYNIKNAIITFCHGRDQDSVRRTVEIYERLKLINNKVRQLGAAALELCFVASSRVDSFFMVGVNAWDVAAGVVVVEEAKGDVTDFDGNSFRAGSSDILASNGKIHEQMMEFIGARP